MKQAVNLFEKTKTCKQCGKTLTIFPNFSVSKEGYVKTKCRECCYPKKGGGKNQVKKEIEEIEAEIEKLNKRLLILKR